MTKQLILKIIFSIILSTCWISVVFSQSNEPKKEMIYLEEFFSKLIENKTNLIDTSIYIHDSYLGYYRDYYPGNKSYESRLVQLAAVNQSLLADSIINFASVTLNLVNCQIVDLLDFRDIEFKAINFSNNSSPFVENNAEWDDIRKKKGAIFKTRGYLGLSFYNCRAKDIKIKNTSYVSEYREPIIANLRIVETKIEELELYRTETSGTIFIYNSDINRFLTSSIKTKGFTIEDNIFGSFSNSNEDSYHNLNRFKEKELVYNYPQTYYQDRKNEITQVTLGNIFCQIDIEEVQDFNVSNNQFLSFTKNELGRFKLLGLDSLIDGRTIIGNSIVFSGNFDNFTFQNNHVVANVEFRGVDVAKKVELIENKFSGFIAINDLLMSEKRNEFEWNQFEGFKLISVNKSNTKTDLKVNFNLALDSSDFNDKRGFYALLSSYKKLFDQFKLNNQLEYANACFAEMKKVETRYFKQLYIQDPSFESYFRWRLNSFLNYFSDYGTNPAKSIVRGFWVIILFSIFYLFFPSSWDIVNRNELLRKSKELVSKNREKSFVWTVSFVAFYGFIHFLNAFTLSVNAFTTLGFGEIPTKGVSRYVAIIQGFLGWFLLTIFSVSLINQVL